MFWLFCLFTHYKVQPATHYALRWPDIAKVKAKPEQFCEVRVTRIVKKAWEEQELQEYAKH
jgi:hypothetical protein